MPARERLSRAVGHEFADAGLLSQALTHRSAGGCNYERLEFLGDSVLELVVSEYLYRRFPDAHEGQLTRVRAAIVREPTLARVARALDLGRHLDLGGGELKSGGFDRDSILADALEAVIGALYLDGGLAPARAFIEARFADELAAANPEKLRKDSKTLLQEYLQSRALELPVYEVLEIAGASHAQRFVVSCRVPGVDDAFRGDGSSKRRAEQSAAAAALEALARSTAGAARTQR